MSEVLQDISASALRDAIEANLYAFSPFSHNWPKAEVFSDSSLSWCITNIPFPWCNIIFNAQLKKDYIDPTIETLIAKGKIRSVPLQWWIGQDTKPANLGEYLVAHGFSPFGDGTRMAIDLFSMKEDVPTT